MKDLQLDLLLSVLNRVRAVADVAADSEGEVATDSTCKLSVRCIIVSKLEGSQNVATNRGKRPEGSLRLA
jgi:hypothetical protein